MQRLDQNPSAFDIGDAYAPPGKRLDHADTITEGATRTAKDKLDLLPSAGPHSVQKA